MRICKYCHFYHKRGKNIFCRYLCEPEGGRLFVTNRSVLKRTLDLLKGNRWKKNPKVDMLLQIKRAAENYSRNPDNPQWETLNELLVKYTYYYEYDH